MFKIQNAHYESTALLPQTEVRRGITAIHDVFPCAL